MYDIRVDGFQPNKMTIAKYSQLCAHLNSDPYKKKQEEAKMNYIQGRGGQGLDKHTAGSRGMVDKSPASPSAGSRVKGKCGTPYIETGCEVPSDEQLMFEAASGSNKGHVYGSFYLFYDCPRLDLVPALFPPLSLFTLMDDATSDATRVDSQPLTGPPSSFGAPPCV
ncbi:hypothetical protein M9H77_06243 [Catharanthus roseus]|uniref:Uncharacterized protein n=1 Tax=Catharanthus roseus TaxID=4058 RepID=A0ACC0BRK8_CATRO|nr:hypothetical protein M9H77_06243 [Catharanthus roseus]